MQLDPLISLIFAMHNNPGVYALLLGSGTSRSAGIPTGWDVVLDLATRLASAQDEDPSRDPARWFAAKYGMPPAYDAILAKLGRTPHERNALLRAYFEPSDEERERGRKIPQAAHRAIARLVRSGHVRVILTTNFDALVETAIQEEGILPDVVSSEDAIAGARPLVHSRCTVVKLHGDYRDSRILNTEDELAQYSDNVTSYLDRILDEHGLLVCGWSGDWDVALRNAILRAPSRRYTTYWTFRDSLRGQARAIAAARDAVTIPIQDADSFFVALTDKIEGIQANRPPHPLSVDDAVASAKHFLSELRYRVRLEDLVHEELTVVRDQLGAADIGFSAVSSATVAEEFCARLNKYAARVQRLLHLAATIAWYGTDEHSHVLTRVIEALLDVPSGEGDPIFLRLRYLPAALVSYAAGVAATAEGRYEHLHALLMAPAFHPEDFEWWSVSPVYAMAPTRIFRDSIQYLPDLDAHAGHTRASEYLCSAIREPLLQCQTSPTGYLRAFDLFEFIVGLVCTDLWSKDEHLPIGSFAWRASAIAPITDLLRNVGANGGRHPLLACGLFGADPDGFRAAVDRYHSHVAKTVANWEPAVQWPNLPFVYNAFAARQSKPS